MTSEAPRKPWYLVVALLLCLVGFGGCGSTLAWDSVERYRGVQIEPPAGELTREDDRKAAIAAYDRFMATLETERPRGFPLAVAELVLSLAIFFFASAAWMGRGGARRALVQILAAQAALVLAAFVLTHVSRSARLEWTLTVALRAATEAGHPPTHADENVTRAFWKASFVFQLIMRSILAVAAVVALTRPRALAYYESQDERPTES